MVAIYGAGLAGLLAANMLRGMSPTVFEAQGSLPNNHGALLRFRSDKAGTACGIPFKKVHVTKAIKYDGKITTEPNLFLSNMYSQKVTGSIMSRSINNLSAASRYIAPWHLIRDMSMGAEISYNMSLSEHSIANTSGPIISTIPMPVLMKIVGWDEIPDFPKQKIYTIRATIDQPDCDIYQTIYYPDPTVPHYRVSVIGNVVICEAAVPIESKPAPHIMSILMDDFGFRPRKITNITSSTQEYGKIRPIDERLRKEFIFQMTTQHNIYSVGRFATWRQILLDDVVDDVKVVEEFIRGKSDYARWMHSQKGENQ